MEQTKKTFADAYITHMTNASMWERVQAIRGIIMRALQAPNATEADIDWTKVNDILFGNIDQYDFNVIDEIHTIDDLEDIIYRVNAASFMDNIPWRRCKCKDCGSTFYMSRGEVEFYQKKKLDIPKRCAPCRAKRKAQ